MNEKNNNEERVYVSLFGWGSRRRMRKDPNRKEIILVDFTTIKAGFKTIGFIFTCIGRNIKANSEKLKLRSAKVNMIRQNVG